MNYIAALALTRKIILLQFLSDCGVDTRSFKAKVLTWKFFPITHSIIYYNQKAKKSFFAAEKSLGILKLLRVLSGRVIFKVILSNSVIFRFLSDWVFLSF